MTCLWYHLAAEDACDRRAGIRRSIAGGSHQKTCLLGRRWPLSGRSLQASVRLATESSHSSLFEPPQPPQPHRQVSPVRPVRSWGVLPPRWTPVPKQETMYPDPPAAPAWLLVCGFGLFAPGLRTRPRTLTLLLLLLGSCLQARLGQRGGEETPNRDQGN